MQYRSSWMTEELDTFRDQFRKFLAKDLAPHAEKWRSQKMVDRSAWRGLGEMGALLPSVPEEYGGLGATFAYDAAVLEDIERRLTLRPQRHLPVLDRVCKVGEALLSLKEIEYLGQAQSGTLAERFMGGSAGAIEDVPPPPGAPEERPLVRTGRDRDRGDPRLAGGP